MLHFRNTLLLALAALLLSGCLAAQQRGLSGSAYLSSSRPAVAVQAKGLPVLTAGRGTAMLTSTSLTGALNVPVHTVVYGSGPSEPMAVIVHAELPDPYFIWSTILPRVGATHEGQEFIAGVDCSAFTYLVPVASDPFAGMVGDTTDRHEPAHWLARYMAFRTDFNFGKIIMEYREPAPEGLTTLSHVPYGMEKALADFEQRAREAFLMYRPETLTAPVQDGYPRGVRWQYMSDLFLGDVLEMTSFDRND